MVAPNLDRTGTPSMARDFKPEPAGIGRFVADIVKAPECYANQNLGISQPNTNGGRPAAYR